MKRSAPMKRTPFKAKPTAPGERKPVKPKTCARSKGGCGERFTPARPLQDACGPICALAMAAARRQKQEARAALEDRKQTRAQLEALKSLKELRAEAQAAFNRFIRLRDRRAGHACICCGQPLNWTSSLTGGDVDAGHFLSRGARPELAFDERNVNAQRKGCNRTGGTTYPKFRAGMVARYGEDVVAELEGPHAMPHLKHDDYRQIRDTYRLKARALEKEAANDSTPFKQIA